MQKKKPTFLFFPPVASYDKYSKDQGFLIYKKYGNPSNKCWSLTDEGSLACPGPSVDQHPAETIIPNLWLSHLQKNNLADL